MKKIIISEGEAIAKGVRSFLVDYAPNQRTGSIHTLESYKTTLSQYMSFLEDKKNVTVQNLTGECFSRASIDDWLLWLQNEQGNSASTCKLRLSNLRSWLDYMSSRDPAFIPIYTEAKKVKGPTPPKTKVEGLTREAVKTLLSLPDLKTRTGRRDLAFMGMAYETAARFSEIQGMKIQDLHLEGKKPFALFTGKGNKKRTSYIVPGTVPLLKKYVRSFHGENPDPEAYVFYSSVKGTHAMITHPAIDKRLKMYAQQGHEICSDIPLNLHMHQFRHARATHWLEDGINIVQISFMLGHEQLETTMKYLDITVEQETRAFNTVHDGQESAKKWKESGGSLQDFCGLK